MVKKTIANCHCFDTFAKFINISADNFSLKNFTIFFYSLAKAWFSHKI
jgi:hypothetical protein